MKSSVKKIPAVKKTYSWLVAFAKAYFPETRAKVAYRVAYGKKCDLKKPKTFSEKLLWLSLNTYRNNPTVLKLCDKYLVREFITKKIGSQYLNELYSVYQSIEDIHFEDLPDSFALKVSQGCTTNIFCEDKAKFDRAVFNRTLAEWGSRQRLYDKMMADIGGVPVEKLEKYYICEKYLREPGKKSPTDYKIYCFKGVPKAILVISDRFAHKTGLFMNTDWTVLSELSGTYHKPEKVYDRPKSLEDMLVAAEKLSEGFPFVRVDMYDIEGQAIFGEMTFFPNGCIHLQETKIDGKTMGELLDISDLLDCRNR